MPRKIILFLFVAIWGQLAFTQELTDQLYTTYGKYQELSLEQRRIKYLELQPLIAKYSANPNFEVSKVGESIEGRNLNLISIGKGTTNIFLWSQMHGDESTATQAIFDILNFLDSKDFETEKQAILSKLKLHFLPMLNPDGAERFQRRNALGVDINRDALRLQSPEGKVLKKIRDSLDADFGFNLHDQSRYYNAERTDKPATISYLATAYNYEKDINDVRANAMKVIVFMNNIIQKYAPGQVGRYNDTFEPRAFGDNIAKWGTALILIESGGYQNDLEKQEIRKLNYVSIVSALHTIAQKSYASIPIEAYEEIPRNDRKLFDLKITNATYKLLGKPYQLDLGIYRNEVDDRHHNAFHYKSVIVDQGDQSTYYGYENFDATGYEIVPPKISNSTVAPQNDVFYMANSEALLHLGQAYVRMRSIPKTLRYSDAPLHVVPLRYKLPKFRLQPGMNPTFFLKKGGKLTHAVINGFIVDLIQPIQEKKFANALILR